MSDLVSIDLRRRRVRYEDGTTARIESFVDRLGFDLLSWREAVSIILDNGDEYELDDVRWAIV